MYKPLLSVLVFCSLLSILAANTIPGRDVSGMLSADELLPQSMNGDWWSQVQKNIAKSEYEIRWQEKSSEYQSANRAQNLRFSYHLDGFKVRPRLDENMWSINMKLTGFGRAEAIASFTGMSITIVSQTGNVEGNGIDISYENSQQGMRENFIIEEKVQGDGLLVLEFVVETNNVTMEVHKGVVKFGMDVGGGAEVLRYGKMVITDKNGKVLEGNFRRSGNNGFAIVVDDTEAVYPVKIDPLSETPDWTSESNQADAYFGYSVSAAGDVNGDGYSDVIIGVPYYDNGEANEGVAFVYHGSASGLSVTPDWTSESNQPNASFGSSVSVAGDLNGDGYSDVIIGAPYYTNGQTNEGCVYVFHGSAGGLSTSPDWITESDAPGVVFGASVSVAGDVNGDGYSDAIIGAPYYDNGEPDEGVAFVYHGSASGLPVNPDWIAESNHYNALFGSSVSTAGDVNGDGYADVIVGAYRYGWGGRAFVYHGSASGLSTTPDWIGEISQQNANFGCSVSTAGDVNGDGYVDVIVGAQKASNGLDNEGMAFVYHGSAGGLSPSPDWYGESNQAGAEFGSAVSIAGDVNGDGYADVIIGSPFHDNGQTNEGVAFVYHGSDSGLPVYPIWSGQSDQSEARFGWSVSLVGDVNGDGYADVIIGAPYYDNGETDEGSAFVYHGSAGGLSTNPDWYSESDQAYALSGYSVSTAGDVNGDGYADVIVGVPYYDYGQDDEGVVYAYHGSGAGLSTYPDWAMQSDQAYALFGSAVSTAGDANGDGYADVIIGAPYYDNDEIDEGVAFVYHGSAGGLLNIPDWTAESDQAYALYGSSVSTARDVNGDGYSDVIVGAPYYDIGQTDEGGAFVYHGSEGGLSTAPNWTAESGQADALFGSSVLTAGDVNGDGYADVIIGAPYCDIGQTDEGVVFVYHGSGGGLSTAPDWTAESDQAYALFGSSVSTAGDVNGDEYADVIIGAPYYDQYVTDGGRVYVYHGSMSGLSTTPDWSEWSGQFDEHFGYSVSTAGDVNGDGYSDVIIGAPHSDHGQVDEGRVYVYHGSVSGLSTYPDWTADSDQADALFGSAVSTSGDVNGDGYSDVIIGAPYYDNGEIDEGVVFVYHGNEGNNVTVNPQQLRADFSCQIVPPLMTHSSDAFGVRFWAHSNYGRVLIRAQTEVKPLGTPFNGMGLVETEWIDTDTTGQQIEQFIDGLTPDVVYKWRTRIKYHLKYGKSQPHSRWLYIQSNAMTECDLRTGFPSAVSGYPSVKPYARFKLTGAYVPGGMKFRCSAPVTLGDGDFVFYNLLGAEIDRVGISLHSAGEYHLEWYGEDSDGIALPNGVYFVRVVTADIMSNTVKFVLIK